MAEQNKKPATGKTTAVAAAEEGNATGLRIGAVCLWVLAIGFEVLALLTAIEKIFLNVSYTMGIVIMIGFLVLDLAALIVGSMLWKKANRIRPASEKNKLTFWLWNNMGVIVAAFAFIPFIILVLTNKNADKRTKTIATIAAVVALLIGGVSSYDFNPISAEQKDEAIATIQGEVYWAPRGHVYHTHEDCHTLARSEKESGTVKEAIENGKERLCYYCANKDGIDTTGILTDGEEETPRKRGEADTQPTTQVTEAAGDSSN